MNVCLICRYECPPCFELIDTLSSSVKKVNCNGAFPKCSLCDSLDVECRYGPVPYQAKTLKRGDACVPCSRKKKRCDAGRPSCSTCKNLKNPEECFYRCSESSNTSRTLQKIAQFASISKNPNQGSNSDSLALSTALDPRSRSFEMTDERLLEFNLFSEFPFSKNASDFQTSWVPTQTWKTLDQNTDSAMSSPKRFMTPSFDHIADQASWFNSAYQISPPLSESLDVLEHNFRLTYLAHRYQFGIYLSFSKQQAILLGDCSSIHIHPFFIRLAEFWGCHLYQERRKDFSLRDLETKYCKRTFAAMETIRDDDPYIMIGAYQFLTKICYYTYAVQRGNYYRQKVKDLVENHNLQFLPQSSTGHIFEISEDDHSKASFLAELVYSDPAIYYVFGDREDLFPDLESQFRVEFPQAYPALFQTCPFILRTVSILCFKDVQRLVALHKDYGTPILEWLSECDDLASNIVGNVATLSSRISYCLDIGDHDTCISFRNSKIIILTALAELYNTSAKASPSFPNMQSRYKTLCRDIIREIVETTAALDPIEFHFLDPITGICWSRINSLLMQDPSCQDMDYPLQNYIDELSRAKSQLEATIRLMPWPVNKSSSALQS